MKRFDDNTATASTDNKVIPISRSKGIDAEDLKRHVDAVGYIGQYTQLKQAGDEFAGLCPLHDETTPSFSYNKDKGTFHCFGCHASGDIIQLVMLKHGLNFKDAIDELAKYSGYRQPASKPVNRPLQAKGKKAVRIPGFLGNTTIEQAKALYDVPLGEDTFKQCIEPYFLSRGIPITLEDARRFHIQADKEKHVLYCPKVDQDGMTVRTWWRPVTPDFLKKEGKEGKAKDFTHNSENAPYGAFVIPGEEGELPRVVMFEGIEDALTYYYHQGKANGETIVAIGGKENWLKAYGHCKDSVSVTLYLDGDKGIGSDNKEEYPCMTERGVQEASKLVRALKADREISVKMYLPARAKWDINQAVCEGKVREWLDTLLDIEPQQEADYTIRWGTEFEITDKFVEDYQGKFCNVPQTDKWLYLDNNWREDALRRISHEVGQYCRKVANASDEKYRRAIARQATVNSVRTGAKDHEAMKVCVTKLDANDWLLGTPGKTIDLTTGRQYEAKAGDYITRQTSVKPEVGEPTRWLQFMNEVTLGDKDMIRYIQKLCGYCLTGSTREEIIIFIYGEGGNGKSKFIEALSYILGDYAQHASAHAFSAGSKAEAGKASPEIMKLKGARLVTGSEVEDGCKWSEVRITELTGGDQVSGRLLYGDEFSFKPTCKVILVGNYMPNLSNVTEAMRRRVHMIPFLFTPVNRDNQLSEKLKAEAGKILTWMIEGCLLWQEDSKGQITGLEKPSAVANATKEYFEEQDTFTGWANDCLAFGNSEETITARLKESYEDYTGESITEKKIATLVKKRAIHLGKTVDLKAVKRHGKTVRGWKGVGIKNIEGDKAEGKEEEDEKFQPF